MRKIGIFEKRPKIFEKSPGASNHIELRLLSSDSQESGSETEELKSKKQLPTLKTKKPTKHKKTEKYEKTKEIKIKNSEHSDSDSDSNFIRNTTRPVFMPVEVEVHELEAPELKLNPDEIKNICAEVEASRRRATFYKLDSIKQCFHAAERGASEAQFLLYEICLEAPKNKYTGKHLNTYLEKFGGDKKMKKMKGNEVYWLKRAALSGDQDALKRLLKPALVMSRSTEGKSVALLSLVLVKERKHVSKEAKKAEQYAIDDHNALSSVASIADHDFETLEGNELNKIISYDGMNEIKYF